MVGNPIYPLVRVCWGQTAKAPEGRDRQCHRKMDEKRMRQRLLQESEMMRQSGMMEKKRGSGLREYTFLRLAVESTSNAVKLKVDQKKTFRSCTA